MAFSVKSAWIALVVAGCAEPIQTNGGALAVASYRASLAGTRASRPASATSAEAAPSSRTDLTSSDGERLRVDACVALAKKNSARLRELTTRVEAAHEAIAAAGQRENPTLQVTRVRLDRLMENEPRVSPRVRFRPERPGEIPAREAEARAAEAAARADLRAEELALEAEVRWMFDDVALLDAEAAAAERLATARRKLAAQTSARAAAATALAVDVNLTELSSLEAEDMARERRSRRSLALEALLDRVGVTAGLDVATDAPPRWPPPPLPPESKLIELALQRDARIASAAASIDGAEARLHKERLRRLPWLTFVDIGYAFTPGSEPGYGWFVGAGVELPLFQMNGAAVRTAESAKDASRRSLDVQVERVSRDVRARIRDVEAAVALVTRLREGALPALARAEQETQRALELAGIDAVKAALVEERRAGLELRLLAGIRRHRTAMSELRRALGGEIGER